MLGWQEVNKNAVTVLNSLDVFIFLRYYVTSGLELGAIELFGGLLD